MSRLQNKYLGTYQFLNVNQAVNLTGNVLDRSAGKMGEFSNRWAYFDIDTSLPTFRTDTNFVITDLTNVISNPNGRYDTVRLHIQSGFDFPGLDGIILQLQWKQWSGDNNGNNKIFDVCNQVYLKGQEQINFNPTPLFLGDRLYDRYIQVKVPSLYEVNQEFWGQPTASDTIGYNYTFNAVGFQQNSQILANLYEIDQSETYNGNLFFNTGNIFRAAFNPADNYSQLSAVIKENAEYDFIEYYPTFNGAFIENYINNLNSVGGNWAVINQIEVYEQVGTSRLRTANMTMLQEGNFDQPLIYRPVIQNAALAYSYTIEYTMRFFNRVDNTQVIRTGTFTSTDVKKYGRELEKINVLQGFTPVKVYNKIVKMNPDDTEKILGLTAPREVITQKVVVPVFYDTSLLSVDSTTNLSADLGQNVWPQGTNVIYLGAFDNVIKFKIFTLSADRSQNVSLDMSSFISNVALAFNTTSNIKEYIPAYIDINLANPAMGEVAFRIDSDTAVKILASVQKVYYIINQTDPETVIYSGKFEAVENKEKGKITASQSLLISLETQIQVKQNELNSLVRPLPTSPSNTIVKGGSIKGGTSSGNALLLDSEQAQVEQTKADQEVVTSAQAAQLSAIQQAANESGPRPNIVEIPGVTQNLGASPQVAVKPMVQNPAMPSVGFNASNNPTQTGGTTGG
jgi:hypothetical protein